MFSRLEPEHEGERLLAVENGVARRDQRLETSHGPIEAVAWFNGGGAQPLDRRSTRRSSGRCSSAASIDKRAQFGAHYTDRDKIPAEFLTHVSPLGWEHINLTGEIPLARHGTDGQRETLT